MSDLSDYTVAKDADGSLCIWSGDVATNDCRVVLASHEVDDDFFVAVAALIFVAKLGGGVVSAAAKVDQVVLATCSDCGRTKFLQGHIWPHLISGLLVCEPADLTTAGRTAAA